MTKSDFQLAFGVVVTFALWAIVATVALLGL
jgi:hypothetical protein